MATLMDNVTRVLVEVLDVEGVRIDDTTNLRTDVPTHYRRVWRDH